jgi:cysteinyl-tRNA synthetase
MECSVMSSKYLGAEFDIHGGGLDLLFPHHECEIAQTVAGYGKESVRYWMHNNMVTLEGQKMGKSLGNAISLEQFFSGEHDLLDKGYHPMTIRFFMLQAHYRSPLDFSNEALQAAEKGLGRLFEGMDTIDRITPSEKSSVDLGKLEKSFFDAMNDDFNSPIAISFLFEGIKAINNVAAGKETMTEKDLKRCGQFYQKTVMEILGLVPDGKGTGDQELSGELIKLLLQMRIDARKNKDFDMADRIRDEMTRLGVEVMDTQDGFEWKLNR